MFEDPKSIMHPIPSREVDTHQNQMRKILTLLLSFHSTLSSQNHCFLFSKVG